MGSSSSRPQQYEQYYQSLASAPDTSLGDFDPYEVLGVSKNVDWEELTQAYRRVARLVHPDKGPPDEAEVRTKMFKVATASFRKVAHDCKMRQQDRPHHDLKREAQAFYASNPARYTSTTNNGDGGVGDSADSFLDRFNRTFEENRMDDDEATIGYGQMMAASSKVREDISVPQVLNKFSRDSFNQTFEKMTLADKKDVVVYREPEALPMAKKVAYTELGGGRPDDFSSSKEGTRSAIEYTDYMKAYTTTRLVDPRAVQSKPTYNNLDAYEADRAKVMATPASKEELAWRARREREQARAEEERLSRLKKRDAMAAEHHDRMNRLMLSGRPSP